MEGLIDRVRRPEYTGENRCVPCTVVNGVISAFLAGIAWAIWQPLAVPVLVVCVLAIYLRGYLVPGTPVLTRRYLPDPVLALFDHEPTPGAVESAEPTDVASVLLDANAIEPCPDRDDDCLRPDFASAWDERMAALDGGDETVRHRLADMLGADAATIDFEETDRSYRAMTDDGVVGRWESRAALVADLAADELMARSYDPWPSFALDTRGQVLNGLRLFLERCPTCDGTITLRDDTVESCCRSIDVVAAVCDDCGVRVFELPVEGSDSTPGS